MKNIIIGAVLIKAFTIDNGSFCTANPIIQIPKELTNSLLRTNLKTYFRE